MINHDIDFSKLEPRLAPNFVEQAHKSDLDLGFEGGARRGRTSAAQDNTSHVLRPQYRAGGQDTF